MNKTALKKRLTTLSLAITLSVSGSGCGFQQNEQEDAIQALKRITDETDVQIPNYTSYESFYKSLEDFNSKNECEFDIPEEPIIDILKQIWKNSSEYVKEHKKYQDAFDDDNLVGRINLHIISVMTDIELRTDKCNEDLCKLNKLRIVTGNFNSENTSEYTPIEVIPEDNLIIINEKFSENSKFKQNPEGYIEEIISETINKLTQFRCEHNTSRIESIKDYGETDFIVDASSSSILFDPNNSYGTFYDISESCTQKRNKQEKILEAQLLALASTSGKQDINEYYNVFNSSNYEELLSFYGATTKKKAYELANIINAMGDEITNSSEKNIVEANYRIILYQKCLEGLINLTETNQWVFLTDNLLILHILQNLFTQPSNESENYEYSKEFVGSFESLTEIFKKYLSNHYKKSEEEINEYKKEIQTLTYILYRETHAKNGCNTLESITYIPSEEENQKIKHFLNKYPLIESIICRLPADNYNDYNNNYYIYINYGKPEEEQEYMSIWIPVTSDNIITRQRIK